MFHAQPARGERTPITNNPPHILILNQYYPPDTSATAKVLHRLSLRLAETYRVTILCGQPSYNPAGSGASRCPRSSLLGPNLQVLRVGSTTMGRARMRDRIINYLSYIALALIAGLREHPDVVIAMTDPPIAYLPAALVALAKRRPLVYHIQDFLPDSVLATGMVRASPLTMVWDGLHRWALRLSDRVIVLGEDMKRRAAGKGAREDRIFVVRSGYYMNDVGLYADPDDNLIRNLRSGFAFVVGYAGNMGESAEWATLVAAIKAIPDSGIGFVFIGEGLEKTRIGIALEDCRNVVFLPYQPEAKLLSVLQAADVQLVTLKRGLEGLCVPSKLYPLLAAGKPVLALVPAGSDVATLVREHRCGLVVEPGQPEAVAAAIRDLAGHPETLREFGQNARAASGRYDEDVCFREYSAVIAGVLHGTGSAD